MAQPEPGVNATVFGMIGMVSFGIFGAIIAPVFHIPWYIPVVGLVVCIIIFSFGIIKYDKNKNPET